MIISSRRYLGTRGVRFLSSSVRSLNGSVPTYKVAMVGSGPAAFYTAYHILNKSPKDKFKVQLDFYERLPAPFGLSRYGVAPDHPEVKNCEEYMTDMLNSPESPVRFFGNVNIGKDITLSQLESSYHSVVLSYGCVNADNTLNIPGNELPGVISARQFVNWYNGHPDFYSSENTFKPPPLDQIKNVTIIGNGNVALDVARVLLADPETHWSATDISSQALEVLKTSTVKNVNIVARRGLLESAFTNKELRELLELNNTKKVKFVPIEDDIYDAIVPYTKKLDRVNKRRVALIEKYSGPVDYEPEKTWSFQYLKSPKEFVVNEQNPQFLSKTIFSRNKVVPGEEGYKIVADPDAEDVSLENDLVVLSIGYKGSALKGFEENGILFDDKQNRIVNGGGKIITDFGPDSKIPIYKPGFYTSGWIKNGPKGVIASTMMDSFDTAENVIQDLTQGIHTRPSAETIDVDGIKYVSWSDWLKLDQYEIKTGMNIGKSREKVCDPEEMLKIERS